MNKYFSMKFKNYLLTSFLLCISILAFAQTQNLKYLKGKIYNKTSGLGIKNVNIVVDDTTFQNTSNNTGGYFIKVPKNIDSINFFIDGYNEKRVSVKRSQRVLNVGLSRTFPTAKDLPKLKNTISYLPLKLLTGAIGFRYERFIKTNISTNLYADYYYKGKQYFGSEEFTGLKTTIGGRYYIVRNKSYGAYAQAGLMLGYFDFEKLNYKYGAGTSFTLTKQKIVWTGGLEGAFGITKIIGNSKHIIVDINMGFQLMPANWAYNAVDEHNREYEHNPLWWYIGGPGSYVEIKLAFGFIF